MSVNDLGDPSHHKKRMERIAHQKTGFASDDSERGLREPMQTDMWRTRGGREHSRQRKEDITLGENTDVCFASEH